MLIRWAENQSTGVAKHGPLTACRDLEWQDGSWDCAASAESPCGGVSWLAHRERKPVFAGSFMAETHTLNAFICYRQTDGRVAAEWLFRQFNGREVTPSDSDTPQRLTVYLDATAPAVSDWVALHRPALELSRVMFIVCSPGAYARQGKRIGFTVKSSGGSRIALRRRS